MNMMYLCILYRKHGSPRFFFFLNFTFVECHYYPIIYSYYSIFGKKLRIYNARTKEIGMFFCHSTQFPTSIKKILKHIFPTLELTCNFYSYNSNLFLRL